MFCRHDEVPLGPGGLNPYDVLERLPENMREAFEEQDTAALHRILEVEYVFLIFINLLIIYLLP
jgi:hypothetical protein